MKRALLVFALAAAWLAAQEHGPAPQQQAGQSHEAGKAGEHGAEHKAGSGEHHEPDATTTMWKWIDFGILVVLIGWGLTKAGPFFRERADEIRKSLEEAQMVKKEAEARAAALTAKLGNLDAELAGLRASAKQEMEAESKRIREETLKQAARIEEQAQQEIASMTKAAESGLKAEAARLALELAEKKVRGQMTPAVQGSLVNRFVAGLRNTVNQ